MTSATSASSLERQLAGLLDLERSRGFHAGTVRLDGRRAQALLDALPPLRMPAISVHIAGSEGKTSTTGYVACGLGALGLRATTFTSPHLCDVRERLRIDGAFPEEAQLERAVEIVAGAARHAGLEPSYFEFLTAVARVLCADPSVGAVVWETGLGGRLDATRCVPADVCAITTISLEHTAILGTTRAAIAAEKAGILRPGRPVALGAGVPADATEVIEAHARDLGCPLHRSAGGVGDVDADNRALARLVLDLLAAEGRAPARTPAADAALDACHIAGRYQLVGRVLYDGAHSAAAIAQLVRRVAQHGVGSVLFGMTSGREPQALLAPLATLGVPIVLTRTPGERGVDPELLRAACPQGAQVSCVDEPMRALAAARELAGEQALVLMTGSLHLVGPLLGGATA
jgi:dihydrofolate synthase/folylpolyglutamate synthase